MKVMTESFSKLINSKLGDVKPILSEQDNKKLDPKKLEVETRLQKEIIKKYGCGKKSDTFDSLVEKYQKAVNDVYEKEKLKVDGILGPKTASQVCPA
jgi:peptidoglycan hydrolase-like protein with peptidoglycan-binding domain